MNEKQRIALEQANAESKFYTRQAITSALMELIKQNEYSKIKITELVEKAGVSRSAFYRNYGNIDDVLLDKIETVSDVIIRICTDDSRANWYAIFHVAEAHADEIKLIIQAGLDYRILEEMNNSLSLDNEYIIRSIWNGIVYNLIIQWILRKSPKSAEEMADIVYLYTKNLPNH